MNANVLRFRIPRINSAVTGPLSSDLAVESSPLAMASSAAGPPSGAGERGLTYCESLPSEERLIEGLVRGIGAAPVDGLGSGSRRGATASLPAAAAPSTG